MAQTSKPKEPKSVGSWQRRSLADDAQLVAAWLCSLMTAIPVTYRHQSWEVQCPIGRREICDLLDMPKKRRIPGTGNMTHDMEQLRYAALVLQRAISGIRDHGLAGLAKHGKARMGATRALESSPETGVSLELIDPSQRYAE